MSTIGIPLRGRVLPLRRIRASVSAALHRRPGRDTTAPVVALARAAGSASGRPEPRLRWTDDARPPAGDFSSRAIVHSDLHRYSLPRPGDHWDKVFELALSYDGDAYWDDLPELATRVLQHWTRHHQLPEGLDELRACLFYEQRRCHHFGDYPTGRSAQYLWALVDAIRARAIGAPRPRPTLEEVGAARHPSGAAAARPPGTTATAAQAHLRVLPAPDPGTRGAARVTAKVTAPRITSVTVPGSAAARVRVLPAPSHGGVPGQVSALVSVSGIADLKPMPCAEALPKPPVITGRRPEPQRAGRVRSFLGDDAGFIAWVGQNPGGYVLNAVAPSSTRTPRLHRADCAALQAGGQRSLTAVRKVCGPNPQTLAAVAESEWGRPPEACRRCVPR